MRASILDRTSRIVAALAVLATTACGLDTGIDSGEPDTAVELEVMGEPLEEDEIERTMDIVTQRMTNLGIDDEWRVVIRLTEDGVRTYRALAGSCAARTAACPTGELELLLDDTVTTPLDEG